MNRTRYSNKNTNNRAQQRNNERKTNTKKIKTDRNVCQFFVLNRCNRGDDCRWIHTTHQCENKECDVYTTRELCFDCHKAERKRKEEEYQKLLRKEGYPCYNKTCDQYTMRGIYCKDCHIEMSQYIMGRCDMPDCNNKVLGGRGICRWCAQKEAEVC